MAPPLPNISGIAEPLRGTELLGWKFWRESSCDDAVRPLAGMLPAFPAALPALAGLLQDLQGLCLTSRVMPSSRLQGSPWLPLPDRCVGATVASVVRGLRLPRPNLESRHHLLCAGKGTGRREGGDGRGCRWKEGCAGA